MKENTVKGYTLMEIFNVDIKEGIDVKIVMLRKTKKKEMKRWRRLFMMMMIISWCYVC